jgi:hypothetical protein
MAEIDATVVSTGQHLAATVSELSAQGCYVDTPEGFDPGTEVHLHMRFADRSCELPGKIIYLHKGWGMGVLFQQAEPQQFEALDEWLAELDQKQFAVAAAV